MNLQKRPNNLFSRRIQLVDRLSNDASCAFMQGQCLVTTEAIILVVSEHKQ